MYKKIGCIVLCLALLLAGMPLPLYATEIGADATQNFPISVPMETVAEATYIHNQLSTQNGSAVLVQDHAKGKYAVKATIGDVSNAVYAQYNLATTSVFNISDYSEVKVWVKPAAGAKWIRFYTNNKLILGDINNDGRYEVGSDLKGGKWNQIKLDLTKASSSVGANFTVQTNDISTWYFDDITSNNTTTFGINLSRLTNGSTTLTDNALRFKTKSSNTYDTVPTILTSEAKDSFTKTETTQEDFLSGSDKANVTATSAGNLELSATTNVATDTYTKVLMHMDGAENGTVFNDDMGKAVTRYGDTVTKPVYKFGTGSAYFDGNGDYLSIPASSDLTFDGDFTIDFWVNFVSTSGDISLFAINNTTLKLMLSGNSLVAYTEGASAAWTAGINSGSWNHIALVRNGTTITGYVNGVAVGTTTYSGTINGTPSAMTIGAATSSGMTQYLNGYIDEFRVSKGIARWVQTPPTAYTADQYTKLLVHMDGNNNGVTFTDDTGKSVSQYGNTCTKTDVKKIGTASAYFDGNGDYLTIPGSADFVFDGDFTIDFWTLLNGPPSGAQTFFGINNTTFSMVSTSTGVCCYFNGGWGTQLPSNLTANKWYHWAIVRSNGTVTVYLNGKSIGSRTDGAVINSQQNGLAIGTYWTATPNSEYFNGYIDEFRVSKGIARWTSNWDTPTFTPPTAPYVVFQCNLNGYRVSPPMDLSKANSVAASTISWNCQTTASTAIDVSTALSTDGGTTYSSYTSCTNGGAIPQLTPGTNLTNARLRVKQTLTTTNSAYTPQLNDITISVSAGEYVDSPTLPNGKISKVFIDSEYKTAPSSPATVTALPTGRIYLDNEKPNKMALAGNGTSLTYKNPTDTKLYGLNLLSGESTLLSAVNPTDIKVSYTGTKAAFRDASSNLYLYDSAAGTASTVSASVSKYAMNKSGTVAYYKSSDSTLNLNTVSGAVYTGTVNCMDIIGNGEQIYAGNGVNLVKTIKTPAGWRSSVVTSVYSGIDNLWANNDGSMIFMKQTDGNYYVYESYSKGVRRLVGLNASAIVKITDDNRIVAQDANYNYFIYDPETDQTTDIRPADALNPTSAAELYFDVDASGGKIAYVTGNTLGTNTGVTVAAISASQETSASTGQTTTIAGSGPERYLLSFDSKNTWMTCKDGDWLAVKTGAVPEKADFDKYGMTKEQVNSLTENDFASLYEDGRQVYNFDVAIYFASVNPYITPSLKGIFVTLSRSNNGFGNELTEKALFAAKQQIFDGSSWRKIRKVYPVEISPKEAEVYYFIKADNNYISYKNNTWQTVYDSVYGSASANLLDNVETNWINITLQGMSAAELRSIPEAALTEKLHNKSFAVVYVLKVLDATTKEYASQIHVDYAEDLFASATLTLNVIYNDGHTKQYTGLTDAQVEDFMQWLNDRQFNRGPVFTRIKIAGNNDFINYYMIQSVNVVEQ